MGAIGVDLYQRYNPVRDWRAVAERVEFAWIKGTDGLGQATVRADEYVKRAKESGIPVGLYHFAQRGPGIDQANVFADEIARLGATGVVPALDIESNPNGPHWTAQTARVFIVDFVNQLRRRGHRRIAIYANVSEMTAFAPWTLGLPDLIYWVARYANAPGKNIGLGAYRGPCDVHQFTSTGTISGIASNVDVNEVYGQDPRTANPSEEDDMYTDEDRARDNAVRDRVFGALPGRQYRYILHDKDGNPQVVDADTPGAVGARYLDEADGAFLLRTILASVAGIRADDMTPEQEAAVLLEAVTTGTRDALFNLLKIEVAERQAKGQES